MLSSSESFASNKVIIVSSKTKNGDVKISARANDEMVEKGLNLGIILQLLSGKYGGIGGGHKIAAGAEIPYHGWKEFLEDLNREVLGALKDEDKNNH